MFIKVVSHCQNVCISLWQMYDVDDPLGPIELHCPHSAPLGSWVECNGSLIRGSRINNTFLFGDGSHEFISLSKSAAWFGSIGNDLQPVCILGGSGKGMFSDHCYVCCREVQALWRDGSKDSDSIADLINFSCSCYYRMLRPVVQKVDIVACE